MSVAKSLTYPGVGMNPKTVGVPATSAAPRIEKAADAFRTISEVSDELDVPQHVLRFWESKFSQIRPLKRGGGRRYYRPEDLALLRKIRVLLYEDGYTIKGVQRLLRDSKDRKIARAGQGEGAATQTLVRELPLFAGEAKPDRAEADPAKQKLTEILSELEQLRQRVRLLLP